MQRFSSTDYRPGGTVNVLENSALPRVVYLTFPPISRLFWLLLGPGRPPVRAQESPTRSCESDEVSSSSSSDLPSHISFYKCVCCDITSGEAICTPQVPGLFLSGLRDHTNTHAYSLEDFWFIRGKV